MMSICIRNGTRSSDSIHLLKDYRRVATQYEKTDPNYMGFVYVAAVMEPLCGSLIDASCPSSCPHDLRIVAIPQRRVPLFKGDCENSDPARFDEVGPPRSPSRWEFPGKRGVPARLGGPGSSRLRESPKLTMFTPCFLRVVNYNYTKNFW